MSDRRPKRRCVSAKSQAPKGQMPSAIHYVGYVEDDETPEMIMKKFEELERIKKAAEARRQQHQVQQQQAQANAPGADSTGAGPSTSAAPAAADTSSASPNAANTSADASQPASQAPLPHLNSHTAAPAQNPASETQLDEEALLEVFRQTSIINVRSALANNGAGDNDAEYGMEETYLADDMGDGGGLGSDLEDDEYLKGFWSDEDYEMGGGGGGREGAAGARRRRAASAGSGRGGEGGAGGGGVPREAKPPRPNGPSRHAQHQVVTQYNKDT
ncbi:hypothetical protein Agub_g11459, partial [Astrephomene gubernaculifera]